MPGSTSRPSELRRRHEGRQRVKRPASLRVAGANPEEQGAPKPARSVGAIPILSAGSRALGPRYRRSVVVLCGLALVGALLETAVLYLIARVATGFTNGRESIDLEIGLFAVRGVSLRSALAVGAVLLAVVIALAFPLSRLSASLSARALTRTRRLLVEGHLASTWTHRSTEAEGHLQTLIGEYAQRVERVVQQMSTIVVAALGTLILAAGAFIVAPLPALCGMAAFLLVVLALRPLSRSVKAAGSSFARANKTLLSQVAQASRVGQEIAAFEVERPVRNGLNDDISMASSSLRQLRYAQRLAPLIYQDSALAVVLAGIALLAAISSDSIGYVGPLVLLMVRALGYAKQLQTAIQTGNEYVPYVEEVDRELALLAAAERKVGLEYLTEMDVLTLDRVSFSYRPGSQVLRDVTLSIEAGETVGVVGTSGAGKSTLSELILRLREPTSGSIRVGRTALGDIDGQVWSRLVAFVPQDNKLIRSTIADNIRFYRSGFSDADVERAAREAHLHSEVIALPDGYDTVVGPGERSLSGGQRQRLGLARALIGHPKLLVLDEPTSALDEGSEHLIKQTLEELSGRATLIVVAHRPTTLEICTRILRVEGGSITELSGEARAVRSSELVESVEPTFVLGRASRDS